ncbi:MAG: hypothetical protein JXR83_16100 [Deltaproteobacteria bacterium]|nr:hypothetical protein [Deltaproteobacteria bacterium]
MAMPQIVTRVAANMGLEGDPRHNALFCMKDGFPIQLCETSHNNTRQLVGIIRFDDASQSDAVVQALHNPAVEQSGLKHRAIKVEDGMITLRWTGGIAGYGKPQKVAGQFSSVLNTVKSVVKEPGLVCRRCGSTELDRPLLVNGVVDRLCPACVDQLALETAAVEQAYDAIPVRVPHLLLAAGATALLGAGLWAGITTATNSMFWLVAIGIGAAIGWATAKAAGKGGLAIQAVTVVATVASVLIGQCGFVGLAVYQYAVGQGADPDLLQVALAIPGVMFDPEAIGDLLFALGGGLVGAVYAAARAGKPRLGVSVER